MPPPLSENTCAIRQRGFTLLELLIVLAILGVVTPVLGAAIVNVNFQTMRNSSRITAVLPLESAGRVLGRDIPLAQAVATPAPGGTPSAALELYWTDWSDPSQYSVYAPNWPIYKRQRITYSVSGSELQRKHEVWCSNWNPSNGKCYGPPPTPVGSTPTPTPAVITPTPTVVSNVAVARNVGSVQFTRNSGSCPAGATPTPPMAMQITTKITTDPHGTGRFQEESTYVAYGTLVCSSAPVK